MGARSRPGVVPDRLTRIGISATRTYDRGAPSASAGQRRGSVLHRTFFRTASFHRM